MWFMWTECQFVCSFLCVCFVGALFICRWVQCSVYLVWYSLYILCYIVNERPIYNAHCVWAEAAASNQTSSYDSPPFDISGRIVFNCFTYVGKNCGTAISWFLSWLSRWISIQLSQFALSLSVSHQAPALEFWNQLTEYNHKMNGSQEKKRHTYIAYLSFCHLVLYKWINLNYNHFADTIIHSLYELIAHSRHIVWIWLTILHRTLY